MAIVFIKGSSIDDFIDIGGHMRPLRQGNAGNRVILFSDGTRIVAKRNARKRWRLTKSHGCGTAKVVIRRNGNAQGDVATMTGEITWVEDWSANGFDREEMSEAIADVIEDADDAAMYLTWSYLRDQLVAAKQRKQAKSQPSS